MEPSQQTGFQQPGFWITMAGFRIPLGGFRVLKPWISGFHKPKLPGFRIPDYLTWGETCMHDLSENYSNIFLLMVEQFTVVIRNYYHSCSLKGPNLLSNIRLRLLHFLHDIDFTRAKQ